MKIFSLVAIMVIAISWCACSDNRENVSGGSVEGNTVVAEVEIDSVKVMIGESSAGETDASKKDYWYEVQFNSTKEEYYLNTNEEWTSLCQINLYPEQNGVEYQEIRETYDGGSGTTFITSTKNGIVINEKWNMTYNDNPQQKDKDYKKIKEQCESNGGKFFAYAHDIANELHVSCTTTVSSLPWKLEDVLKRYADQYKEFCKEDGL